MDFVKLFIVNSKISNHVNVDCCLKYQIHYLCNYIYLVYIMFALVS